MNRFRSLLTAKVLVPAAALVLGAGIYVASLPKSDAIIIGQGVCVYYSDAKYKTAVGARGTGCCGSVINWGIITAYRKCEQIYCTDQICPN
jgi:Family of unknown function (DUF6289)